MDTGFAEWLMFDRVKKFSDQGKTTLYLQQSTSLMRVSQEYVLLVRDSIMLPL